MKSTRLYSIAILLYLSVQPNIHAQEKTQAQQDWEHLDHMKNFFCKAPEECAEYDNGNMLEGLQFEDRVYTNRSKLAEAFLDNYPDDPHYDEALALFFSSYFRPRFIPDSIAVDRAEAIAKLPRRGQAGAWFKAYRMLPIDVDAKQRWLDKGNQLINNILKSDTSMVRKARAEMLRFSRDYRMAANQYVYLEKGSMERDFWLAFAGYYFEPLVLRLERFMDTYPNLDNVAQYIQSVLDDLRRIVPELARVYMDRFFIRSGENHPLANHRGIQALHRSLSENMEAMKSTGAIGNKPLDMAFMAMDGSYIDLADMRGKVILIDFWSINCPPCITAMPHLKALYDSYRDKGFEIIGIVGNGDGAKQQVTKIVDKVKAPWRQRLDQGKAATVSFHTLYQIEKWPTYWLLDKTGKVVDRDVSVSQLENSIRQYLEEK